MKKILLSLCALFLMSATLPAQIRRATVVTYGDATVTANPDQVKVSVGVTTKAPTAQDAAAQNAVNVTAVIAALQKILGANADIKTISYSVSPGYTYPPNGTPVLNGYTASNTVDVTSSDIAGIGKVMDAATNAGATTVQSLRFSVKDETPLKAQALRQATLNARSKADSIALGVSLRVGNVLSVQEGYNSQIVTVRTLSPSAGAAAPTTPVEPGLVQVTASVTLEMELL
jgi:uncharacterized protein YggE